MLIRSYVMYIIITHIGGHRPRDVTDTYQKISPVIHRHSPVLEPTRQPNHDLQRLEPLKVDPKTYLDL